MTLQRKYEIYFYSLRSQRVQNRILQCIPDKKHVVASDLLLVARHSSLIIIQIQFFFIRIIEFVFKKSQTLVRDNAHTHGIF